MLFDLSIAQVMAYIHHGGIMHIQEAQDVANIHDCCLFPVQALPQLPDGPIDYKNPETRFEWYTSRFDGIIMCHPRGIKHAVAWNHKEQKVYDPNGLIYGIDSLVGITEIWCKTQVRI